MEPKIIEEQWLSYRDEVMPRGASDVQIVECRRAFYAGARALYTGILLGLSPDKGVTQADLDKLERVERELQDFVA